MNRCSAASFNLDLMPVQHSESVEETDSITRVPQHA